MAVQRAQLSCLYVVLVGRRRWWSGPETRQQALDVTTICGRHTLTASRLSTCSRPRSCRAGLAKDEFDLRVGRVLASRTYADLDALTADIPAALLRPQLPEPARETVSAPARESAERKIVKAWAGATVVLPSVAVGVALLKSGTDLAYIAIAMALFACVVAVPVSGLLMLHSWIEKRYANGWDEPGAGESEVTG